MDESPGSAMRSALVTGATGFTGGALTERLIRDEIAKLVTYLCELDPLKRGHPLNLAGRGSEYGVERFESRFDYMASREELSLRRFIT